MWKAARADGPSKALVSTGCNERSQYGPILSSLLAFCFGGESPKHTRALQYTSIVFYVQTHTHSGLMHLAYAAPLLATVQPGKFFCFSLRDALYISAAVAAAHGLEWETEELSN